MLLRRNYYWKGIKPQVYRYVKQCQKCQQCNSQVVKYNQGQFQVPKAPMDFISMDLIGEFHPPTAEGYKYALTVICMLTGFTWCIPVKSKMAKDIVEAYMKEVYYKYGGSRKILSDNGTEFKNELFTTVAKKLGVEHKIYSPPFHPQSNGRIEGFHHFLKACLAKHVCKTKEWSEIVPMACAAYNFFPNEHSRESPFFLMFGRDPRIPLMELLTPRVQYLGTDECILSLEALTEIYHLVAQNLKLAREKMNKKSKVHPLTFTVGDMVLLHNHEAKSLEPRFKGYFRIIAIHGNQVHIIPREGGPSRWAHVTDMKYVLPVDAILDQMPAATHIGRPSKLNIYPSREPDLGWSLATTLNTVHTTTTNTSSLSNTQVLQDNIVTISCTTTSVIPL